MVAKRELVTLSVLVPVGTKILEVVGIDQKDIRQTLEIVQVETGTFRAKRR